MVQPAAAQPPAAPEGHLPRQAAHLVPVPVPIVTLAARYRLPPPYRPPRRGSAPTGLQQRQGGRQQEQEGQGPRFPKEGAVTMAQHRSKRLQAEAPPALPPDAGQQRAQSRGCRPQCNPRAPLRRLLLHQLLLRELPMAVPAACLTLAAGWGPTAPAVEPLLVEACPPLAALREACRIQAAGWGHTAPLAEVLAPELPLTAGQRQQRLLVLTLRRQVVQEALECLQALGAGAAAVMLVAGPAAVVPAAAPQCLAPPPVRLHRHLPAPAAAAVAPVTAAEGQAVAHTAVAAPPATPAAAARAAVAG